MSPQPNKRSLIYETVLEHIKGELLKGNLKPGDRLPTVSDMANTLDVGLASAREAYRVLETLGILTVTQGRGTFVSPAITRSGEMLVQFQAAEQQSISHLIEARKLLEPPVAALAARRATAAEADAILAAAREMETLYRQGEDFIEPDVHFHELIFHASHNPVLAKLLSALANLLLDSRRLTIRIPGSIEKAVHYHKLIAIAIKEGNDETAHTLMYHHIDDIERGLAANHLTAPQFPKEI